jgi:hypothetical protein
LLSSSATITSGSRLLATEASFIAVANRGQGWHVPPDLEELVVAAGLEESRRVADAERDRASMTTRQFRDTLASIREQYYDDFLRTLAGWATRQVCDFR